MALAQGDLVFLDVDDGLRFEPPPFGVVDLVGVSPSAVRVVFGSTLSVAFASAVEATNRLVKYTEDPASDSLRGRRFEFALGDNVSASGHIMRSFFVGATQTVLVEVDELPVRHSRQRPLFAVVPYAA